MTVPLLEVDTVSKFYRVRKQQVTALDRVSLKLESNMPEIVALAGESGSGKSTLANLILGFDTADEGTVRFAGEDISIRSDIQMRDYREQVQAVFQDPFGVFNPFYRVHHVFDLVFRNFRHRFPKQTRSSDMERALNSVGLQGNDVLSKYPHQLSGGQRQRIMMARACLMQPKLIVADEPVSMVDASLRAAILDVMMRMRDEHGISFLYITHDLATAYQVCDKIMLLYQGRVLEQGAPQEVIGAPKHPYSKLLVGSIPGTRYSEDWVKHSVDATVQDNYSTTVGCCFASRCEHAAQQCGHAAPQLEAFRGTASVADDNGIVRRVACHFHEKL